MHEGHRERMLQKLENYSDSLTEHELLEILLYFSIPRVNTNPVAHRLIAAFGSVEKVLAADMERLQTIEGVGASTAAFLHTVGIFFSKYRGRESSDMPEKYDDSFIGYLKKYYASFRYEELTVFFLDDKNHILFRKSFTSGLTDHIQVPPAEITKCIGNYPCYGIILAHNHIGAAAKPSLLDDEFTKQCEILFSINNVRLLDHIIVSNDGTAYSYYQSGKMAEIARNFHVRRLVRTEKGAEQ